MTRLFYDRGASKLTSYLGPSDRGLRHRDNQGFWPRERILSRNLSTNNVNQYEDGILEVFALILTIADPMRTPMPTE